MISVRNIRHLLCARDPSVLYMLTHLILTTTLGDCSECRCCNSILWMKKLYFKDFKYWAHKYCSWDANPDILTALLVPNSYYHYYYNYRAELKSQQWEFKFRRQVLDYRDYKEMEWKILTCENPWRFLGTSGLSAEVLPPFADLDQLGLKFQCGTSATSGPSLWLPWVPNGLPNSFLMVFSTSRLHILHQSKHKSPLSPNMPLVHKFCWRWEVMGAVTSHTRH